MSHDTWTYGLARCTVRRPFGLGITRDGIMTLHLPWVAGLSFSSAAQR